jgi:hypothetical protein
MPLFGRSIAREGGGLCSRPPPAAWGDHLSPGDDDDFHVLCGIAYPSSPAAFSAAVWSA